MGDFLSAKNLSTRILLVVVIAFTLLTVYFIQNAYHDYLSSSEKQVVERLYSIAKTTALQVDGDALEYLINSYPNKNDITENEQDSIYQEINATLSNVVKANELSTALYILVKSKNGPYFEFIVSSSNTPYFRHSYKEFPSELMDTFDAGGKLDVHSSENGRWLSAFAPIKNREGETVAVVQSDRDFDEFYDKAKDKLIKDLLISLGIFIVILAVVFKFLRSIIKQEEEQKKELEKSYKIIAHKNKDISDSINYAKRIQDALIPSTQDIKDVFPESYVFFRGKDVVSGDFPFLVQKENNGIIYIASVDCTGHGVPGALISIIGNFLLNDLIVNHTFNRPGEVLNALHFNVVNALNQEQEGSLTNDGMDIALIKVDTNAKSFEFAGAHRPLIMIKDGELEEIKGSRLSIGGTHYTKRGKKMHFETFKVDYSQGDHLHFFSDGYPDQFGGPEMKKFGSKNMREFFKDRKDSPMEQIGVDLEANFDEWKADHKQMDDVLVIGIKF